MAKKKSQSTAAGVKRVQSVGTDLAFTIKTSSRDAPMSYWDLWFLVAGKSAFGGLDGLAGEFLRRRRDSYLEREDAWEKLSHLRDLQRRLREAGIGEDVAIEAAGTKAAAESRIAKGKVLDHAARPYERSMAMAETPDKPARAFALRGHWDRFPESPEPHAQSVLKGFNPKKFYGEDRSFSVARRLDKHRERARKAASGKKHARALAMLRGLLTATLEVYQCCDDSYGVIGESYEESLRAYSKIYRNKAGIAAEVFFHDLLELVIWEDYGFTGDALDGYFARLSRKDAELCIEYLRERIEWLKANDLEYQAEEALTLLGQVVSERCCWERFEPLAREMGSREPERVQGLAAAALKGRKRDLAKRVFEAALTPGPQYELLMRDYESLKRGKWRPNRR